MDILALVAHNEILVAENAQLQAQLAALQPKVKPERTPCPRVTSKGSPCKKYCVPGEQMCKVHGKPPKPVKTRKEKPKKVHCTGLNMRGNPCKGKCLPGETYCERHDPKAPPKQTQKKKQPPEHTHGIGVEPLVPCELCETHSDIDEEEENLRYVALTRGKKIVYTIK